MLRDPPAWWHSTWPGTESSGTGSSSDSGKNTDKPFDPNYVPTVPLKPYTIRQLNALQGADSVTIDPHKSGYCPYPGGGLVSSSLSVASLRSSLPPRSFQLSSPCWTGSCSNLLERIKSVDWHFAPSGRLNTSARKFRVLVPSFIYALIQSSREKLRSWVCHTPIRRPRARRASRRLNMNE